MRELHLEARPQSFKEVVGQDDACRQLVGLGKEGNTPHCLLFTGPSGVGKTTLARIVRLKLGCGDADFVEINASENRGIEMVRDIQSRIGLSPIDGKCRVWLIDECFAPGTDVCTPQGKVSIENIKVGDTVFSSTDRAPADVERIFNNRVPLGNVVKLTLSNGRVIFTTKQHLFYTQGTWKVAEELTGSDLLFTLGCGTMEGKHLQRSTNNAKDRSDMPVLRESVSGLCDRKPQVLRQIVSCEGQNAETGNTGAVIQPGNTEENIGCKLTLYENGKMERRHGKNVGEDENQQPNVGSMLCAENEGCQENKRDAKHLEGGTGREWETYTATDSVGDGVGVGNGSGCFIGGSVSRVSNMLQVGCGKSCIESRDRGGREGTQNKDGENAGHKEGGEVARIWVESSEVYQQGYNDESFIGVIGDKERNQRFVVFHDLQISGHPSYFVEDVLVHNCQACTPDAQGAFLKLLEEPPNHVYFMLATTNPEKLRAAIRTRCTEIKLKKLTPEKIKALVTSISEKHDCPVSDAVMDKIAEVAEGSARKALVLLQQVAGMPDEAAQIRMLENADAKQAAIEIARALLAKKPWGTIASIIKGCDEEPESIRWMMMAYFTSVALNGKDAGRCVDILEEFRDNYYDTKKAGLVISCYRASKL